MNFVSYSFVVLFLVVFVCRLLIGRRKIEAPYVAVLIVASAIFYAWHVPVYLWILLLSTVIDYAAGLYIGTPDRSGAPRSPRARRRALIVSLSSNLGLLAFFKYANFGIANTAAVLERLGMETAIPHLGFVLPMGISFYTFQSMSYTIDVYRGQLKPVRSFSRFFLYISFFPQLVAGPIVRAVEFVPQVPRPRRLRWCTFNGGAFLLAQGFFLKMVCADNLAVYVDRYWEDGYAAGANSGVLVWLALLFSGQIFADFAGYSNIARGLALLLGYHLPVNFDRPYIAGSFKNFWERWHITLSRWLRDYLYVPLGGNRISPRRTYVNLLLVMLLGGLWHGAAWTFVVWGALHGGALALERLAGLQRADGWRGWWATRLAWFVIVQAIVLVSWIFFRSESLDGALTFLANIAAMRFSAPNAVMIAGSMFLLPLVALHVWGLLEERGRVRPLGPASQAVLAGLMVIAVAIGYGGANAFIYFQF